MKNTDFASLGGKLSSYLHGYRIKGPLVFAEPIGHILRGICFDSSSHNPKSFYINVFFQPLCVLSQNLHFTLGSRLRDMSNHDGWDFDNPSLVADIGEAISTKALPFLDSVTTLEGAARAAEAMQSPNSHVQEAAACCWALSGYTTKALFQLDKLCNALKNADIAWQVEQFRRVHYLKELLRHDPNSAREQLLTWESRTAQNIGLGSFLPKAR